LRVSGGKLSGERRKLPTKVALESGVIAKRKIERRITTHLSEKKIVEADGRWRRKEKKLALELKKKKKSWRMASLGTRD